MSWMLRLNSRSAEPPTPHSPSQDNPVFLPPDLRFNPVADLRASVISSVGYANLEEDALVVVVTREMVHNKIGGLLSAGERQFQNW